LEAGGRANVAIEAALGAERMQLESDARRRQMMELDLQQARYEASLAEREPRLRQLRRHHQCHVRGLTETARRSQNNHINQTTTGCPGAHLWTLA